MEIGWLWLALGLAWLVNLLLLVWTVRLRMEVWANRRVIAALEAAVHHSQQKGRSNRTKGVGLAFLLVAFIQLLLILWELWL
jgi:hypothetical protein